MGHRIDGILSMFYSHKNICINNNQYFCGHYQLRERDIIDKQLLTCNWVKRENVATMGEKIKRFVIEVTSGFSQAMVISPNRAYVRPSKGAFQNDSINLHNDAKKVGNDLKKQIKQFSHGKS